MVLIEVGAQSNTKEEVQATVEIIAKAIGEYLGWKFFNWSLFSWIIVIYD